MSATIQKPDVQKGSEFAHLLTTAETHGFSISEDERPNRHLILFRGTPAADHFIHAVSNSNPERLDFRIIRYQKRYAQQPIGAESDVVTRLPLFVGSVDPSDEPAIRAILQSTVGNPI
ncbi:hypothetical protein [Larkinella sp.]|uniref:hypothetical protein n=1 Tax=Larkinella sp. TaxID=2034517 RepID=UPI003BAD824D